MRVSQPGDREEIEADRSADRVAERLARPFFKPSPAVSDRAASIARAAQNESLRGKPEESLKDKTQTDEKHAEVSRQKELKSVSGMRQKDKQESNISGQTDESENTDVMRQKEDEQAQLSLMAEESDELSPAHQENEEDAVVSRQADESEESALRQEKEEERQVSRQVEDTEDVSTARQDDEEDAVVSRQAAEAEDDKAMRVEQEGELQARANGPGLATPELHYRINQSKGRGQSLSLGAQAEFGAAFGGRDFSNIRIHTGTDATRLSADLNARAFAHAQDIYFSEGRFKPDTREGQHLLAHELTHTIQSGNAPMLKADVDRSFIEELLEQIKLSNKEARQAEDPRPAAEARKEAYAKGQKALSDVKHKPTEAKLISVHGKKQSKPEPRIAQVKRHAPAEIEPTADALPKGEVGQYLDEQSTEVCNKGAAKSQRLADNESAHDPANKKLEQSEAAVSPPQKENQSRNEAEQIRTVQSGGDPRVMPDANHAKLDSAIEESVPESIEELNEFASEGKGRVVGNAVLGAVQKDVNTVRGTYRKIENVKPGILAATPDALPVVETAPGTSLLNLGRDAVPLLAEEHTDFTAIDQQSDELLQQEQITDEQLSMVDSGDLAIAHQERQGLKKKIKNSPQEAQQFAVEQTTTVDKDMQSEERATRNAMGQKRKQGLEATETKQKSVKTELELKRENVTKEVNRRFEAVKASVTRKLDTLEGTSLRAFDREQKRYSSLFEQDVRQRVNRWKNKRYSGIFAGVKWLKDKIVGIDHFPEVKNAFSVARKAYVKNIDRLINDINDANATVIAQCKQELKTTKEKVQEYIEGLEPDLRKTGQSAMKDMKSRLKELEGLIDKRKEALQNKLCEKKEQAIEAIDRKIEQMKSEMSGALSKLGNLLLQAALKFFKWALEKAGLKPKALLDVINKGVAVIKKIVTSPIDFFKNLARAVGTGIGLFVKNIKMHLLNGMMSWLTGQMGEIGITLPARFDLKGIFSLVLQILGLTWANIRQKLVKRVGERAVAVAEKTVDIIRRVRAEGPIALWHMIKEKAAEIKAKIIAKVRDWVIVQVVKKAVAKIAMMLNPVGAIVQAAIAIYDLVMFFVENIKRIIEFVKSVLNSISKIAAGAVGAAAAFIENAMARTVPIILSFLARFFGVNGIGKVVQKVIRTIRKPVDKVVGKALDFIAKIVRKVVGKAKALGKKAKAKVKTAAGKVIGKLKRWWRKKTPFSAGGEKHYLFFKSSKPESAIMVASDKNEVSKFLEENKQTGSDSEGELAKKYGAAKAQLAKVERARTKLLNEIKKSKTLTKKQQVANEKLKAEWILLRQALIGFMSSLKGQSEHVKTDITYDGLQYGELGKGATAWPLTIKGDEGSSPRITNRNWDQVRLRAKGKGTFFVRGHLINDNLHGPGTEARNLTPISQKANADHKVNVEEKVKDVVWNRLGKGQVDKNLEGKAVKYRVVAEYGSDFRPGLADMKMKIANATQDEERHKVLTKIVENELKLPSKLVCSAEIVDRIDKTTYKKSGKNIPLGNGGIVDNHIPESVPELTGEPPRVLVRLSLSDPGSSETEAIKAISVVDGIDKSRAKAIYDARFVDEAGKDSKAEAIKAISVAKGIDESRATAIYDARFVDENGKDIRKVRDFKSWADLEARAKGLGAKSIDALRNYLFRGKTIVRLKGKTEYED